MLDLATTRTREITREERFDLDDERVVLRPLDPVFHEVRSDAQILTEGNSHHRTLVGRAK